MLLRECRYTDLINSLKNIKTLGYESLLVVIILTLRNFTVFGPSCFWVPEKVQTFYFLWQAFCPTVTRHLQVDISLIIELLKKKGQRISIITTDLILLVWS